MPRTHRMAALLLGGLALLAPGACRRPAEPAAPAPAPEGPPAPAEAPTAPQPAAPTPAAAATAAEPPIVWRARAAKEGDELTQTAAAPDRCIATARRGGEVSWVAMRCLARTGQLVFLGADGETAIAIEPFVPTDAGPERVGPVVVVTRRGEVVRAFRPAELAPREQYARADPWLTPVDGAPDLRPALTADGEAVRFGTRGGTTVVLRFDGQGWPRPPASRAAARPGALDPDDESTIYRWEDAGGETHFSLARDVPADRAASARPASGGGVSVVAVERVQAPAEDRPAAAPTVQLAPAPAPAPPRRSTYHVDTINKLGPVQLDAEAMDKQYAKQKQQMNCREKDGVVICG